MTKKFENTPRAQEITRLFQLHEDAVAAYKTADNDGMENSNPAQFRTIEDTMHKAYRVLVDFIDTDPAPAEAAPVRFPKRQGAAHDDALTDTLTDLCRAVIGLNKKDLKDWWDEGASWPPTIAKAFRSVESAVDAYAAPSAGQATVPDTAATTALLPDTPKTDILPIMGSEMFVAALSHYTNCLTTVKTMPKEVPAAFPHLHQAAEASYRGALNSLSSIIDAHTAEAVTMAMVESAYAGLGVQDKPAKKKGKGKKQREVSRLVPVFRPASELLPDLSAPRFKSMITQAVDAGASQMTITISLPDTCKGQTPVHGTGNMCLCLPKYASYQIIHVLGDGCFIPVREVKTPEEVLAAFMELQPHTPKNRLLQVYGLDKNGQVCDDINLVKWVSPPTAQDTPEAA